MPNLQIIRERQCRELTGLSGPTRWRREKEGRFPRRVKLNPDSQHSPIGWYLHEVQEWIATRERGIGFDASTMRNR